MNLFPDRPVSRTTAATDLVEQAYTLERRAFVRCRLALLRAGDGCLSGEKPALAQSFRKGAAAAWQEWETSVAALRRLAHLDPLELSPEQKLALREQRREAADIEEQAFRRLMELLVGLRHSPEGANMLDEAGPADAEWREALSKLEPAAHTQ